MSAALRIAELFEAGLLPDDDNTIVFCAAVLAPVYGHTVTPSSGISSYATSRGKT